MKEGVLAEPVNISEVAFRAMKTGYCTYLDLDSSIGLEGALNLIEVSQVVQYNKDKIAYYSQQEQNNG